MALLGSVTTSSSHNRSLMLSWTASQNNVNNTSTISWTLKGSGSASGFIKVHAVKVTIDGAVVHNVSDANCECYNGTTVASGNKTISHKSDGTKSFTIKVEAGIYTYAPNCSGSSTFTLDTIAKASAITSASNTTLGQSCQIKWTPKATSFYYKLKFVLGNWGYTTSAIHPNQTTEYTYSGYTIPLSTVAQRIPNAKTGTMTVYLYTYSDSAATNQVGATSSKTFTVTVPDSAKPTLSTATVSLDNSANSTLQGWGIAVTNFTKVKVHAEASGIYGSSIKSFTVSGGYNQSITSGSPLNYTGAAITSSGDKSFSVKVTDSRGISSNAKSAGTVHFYPYSEPSITLFMASRVYSSASEGRTTIAIKANWAFASVNNKNSVTATLKYKRKGNTSWLTYGTIPKNTEVRIAYPTGGNSQTGFPESLSYYFRLEIVDALSSTTVSEVLVPTAEVLLDFKEGGKGLGIGKFAESDRLEIRMDTVFEKPIKILSSNAEVPIEDYIPAKAKTLLRNGNSSAVDLFSSSNNEIDLGGDVNFADYSAVDIRYLQYSTGSVNCYATLRAISVNGYYGNIPVVKYSLSSGTISTLICIITLTGSKIQVVDAGRISQLYISAVVGYK